MHTAATRLCSAPKVWTRAVVVATLGAVPAAVMLNPCTGAAALSDELLAA